MILLATDRNDAGGDAGGDVEDPVEPEEPIGNRAPVSAGSITDLELEAGGESGTVDAAPYFSDPDGDDLSYSASTSDPQVATVTVSGSSVTVAPVAEGTARITVTARDRGALSAEQTFDVNVSEEAVDGGGGGTDSYCRDGDVVQPGRDCEIYEASVTFDVSASGRGCVRSGGINLCNGNSLSYRNTTLNGQRITFVADRNDDDSWTIEDVEPEPPD